MNFIKKKTIRLSISWLLIFSLLSTSVLPTFSSLSTNVQAQEFNGYEYQEADFTVRDNSAEIKDIENLLATEKPSWQSPSFTKKSPEYQAITQPELVTEYPEYNLSSGSGGTYLEVIGSSVEVFSPKGVKAQSVTLNWQDSLSNWISSRETTKYEAKAPVPSGYTTSVYVKDKVTGKEYKIRGNQEDNNGKNSFTWDGTDVNGNTLPDGVYEWYIKAAPQTVVFAKTVTVPDVDENGNRVFIDIETDVTETAPSYSPEYSFITLDQTQPEILAIHDLGNNKIGIETRDEVSGVKIVNAINKQTFDDHPLHVIAPINVTQNDSLTITIQDWAGNEVTETLPAHPATTHTGNQSFYPNVSETIAGENVGINLYSGNGIVTFEGFTQPGIGLDVNTDITYNHQNRQKGLLGYGFTFDFEHKITPWINGDATYISGDGTKYLFKKNGSGYTTYVGGQEQYYPQLTKTETQIILIWEDLSAYTFSKDGRILEQKDRYGNKNTFTYEEIDKYHKRKEYRLDYITGSTNKKVDLIYNTETGKLEKIQGPGREEGLTREVSFEYQDNKLIYKNVMNASTTIAFDSLKRVESITKPNNVTTDWSYGSKNRLERVSMTRSQDNVEEFINVNYQDKQAIITNPISEYNLTWDMQGRPDSKKESVEVAGSNNTTKIETAYTYYTYDRNNLVKTVDPMGIITESAYDDRDRLKATKSPSGSVMNYQYNDKNDLVLETGPYGYKIEYQYNYSGNKILNAKTIKHVQDPYGRTTPYQATSQIYYQANGLVDYEIDGNKNNINYNYDSNGFLTNDGFDTTYTNDLVGNVKTKTAYAGTSDANTTTFEYNDRNQQVKVIYPELIQVNENGSRYSQRLIQEDNYNQLSGLLESTEQYDQFNPSKRMSAEYLYDDGNNNIKVTTDTMVTKSKVDGVGNTTKTITYPLNAPNEQLVKEYIYNSNGSIEKVKNLSGEIKEYQYNKTGKIVKSITTVDLPADYNNLAILPTDIEPIITTYEYSPDTGLLKSINMPDGGKKEYINDLYGRKVIIKEHRSISANENVPFSIEDQDPNILVSATRYNSIGQATEQLSQTGIWTRYEYDGNGKVSSVTFGGPIPEWDGQELLQGERDSFYSGHEVISTEYYQYDSQGRVLKETDGEGYTTEYIYDGLKIKKKTPGFNENRNLVYYTSEELYDVMGNLSISSSNLQYKEKYLYDVFGKTTKHINPEGKTLEIIYNDDERIDRTIEEWDDSNNRTQTIQYKYDSWGNKKEIRSQIDGYNYAITQYEYNKIGNLEKEISPEGKITEYQYDSFGNVRKEIVTNKIPQQYGAKEEKRVTEHRYDLMGREYMTIYPKTSDSSTPATEYTLYDTNGNSVVLIDGEGKVERYHYDEDGKTIAYEQYGEISSFNNSNYITQTYYLYDGFRNKRLVKNTNDYLTVNVYDKVGRKTEEHFEGKELGGLVETNKIEYDPRGLEIAKIDGEGNRYEYFHDADGNVVKEVDAEGVWTSYEYNKISLATAIKTPSGRNTYIDYNLRGQETSLKDALNDRYIYNYNDAGFLVGESNKNQEYISYQHDKEGNIKLKLTPSEGTYTYNYDSVGNMVSKTEPEYGTTYYVYDEKDQLRQVNESGDNRRLITKYTYDNVGNMLTQTDSNNQTTRYGYDYGNRKNSEIMYLNGVAYNFNYQYDGLDNQIYEKQPNGTWIRKKYDFKNRLESESYSDGNYITYTYYKNDKVKTETSPAGTTFYTYYKNGQVKTISYPSGDFIEYKYDDDGDLKQEIVNGQPRTYNRDDKGLTSTFVDNKGFVYEYIYTPDGLIDQIKLPNGT